MKMAFSIEVMVRGYHEYKAIWAALIGEELTCQRKRGKAHNAFAVAVKNDGRIITLPVGMGRYRYQIFDTVDTGLRCDGIDTRKQYRRVSIHARAALRMRKVYVSTRSRENQ